MSPAYRILDRLCSDVLKHMLFSYFITDKAGTIKHWSGDLNGLRLEAPKQGSRIEDVLLFMENILPLGGEAVEFSCIKMGADTCLDAGLFRIEDGYAVFIWDSTQKEAVLTRTQQQCNELALLIEEQKNSILKYRDSRMEKNGSSFLEDLFKALNYAVLEMNEEGHFVLLGNPPTWINQLPQSSRLLSGKAHEEDVYSFLGNFIREAKKWWQKNPTDTFKSGTWIEKDHTGQEVLFEATGIAVQGRKLLIIVNDVCNPQEKQSLIQKGRDLALHYHELKRSDNELRNMHDALEERVRERTRDLELANQRLAEELKERQRVEEERAEVARQLRQSRKMEAIGTLAGGIAHDFNNILSAIMGFTELSIVETGNNSALKNKLEKVLNASERAKELVRQILTFSRQSDDEKRPLKLRLVVKETLNLLRASLPTFIDIHQRLESDTYILADPTQIHQVVMNLCTNAWHAMQENGGILSVSLTDKNITGKDLPGLPGLKAGPHVCLSVADKGCGIPEDVMDRIFDPYFTTKDKNKGTGLGLSIVHGIVTGSGGCIQVSSQKGEGTKFEIFLPSIASENKESSEETVLPSGNNEMILFVDDEEFQTEMAEELIARLGYRVTAVNDSSQALNIFKADIRHFDLVITDMIMPKMTGKTLVREILATRPDMPVILCSGYSDEIDMDFLKEIGVAKYLMKPVDMKSLASAIQQALQK